MNGDVDVDGQILALDDAEDFGSAELDDNETFNQDDDNVFHERFGKGKVIEIEYDGNNSRATINFQNSGQKKVLLRFAKLKILK